MDKTMKAELKKVAKQLNRRPASIHNNTNHAAAGFVDDRCSTAVQLKLMEGIASSPQAVAGHQQIQLLHNYSGQTCQLKTVIKIKGAAKKHYKDGWGALYNIQNDSDLKGRIPTNAQNANRDYYINLGRYTHTNEGVRKRCNILYTCYTPYSGANTHKTVKHCGPYGVDLGV